MNIFPGKMVLYIWRPGQVRARQSESAAMITRVNPDGTVNLTVYPDGTPDPLFLRNVAAMSDAVPCHCWHPNPDDAEREKAAASASDRKPRKAAA
jgi:hypothetical protein